MANAIHYLSQPLNGQNSLAICPFSWEQTGFNRPPVQKDRTRTPLPLSPSDLGSGQVQPIA